MATHESAKKRARQAEVNRLRNRAIMSEMKGVIRAVREAIEKKDLANLDNLMRDAQSVIAKTRRKGTIHANNMSRRISRLTKAANKAKTGA